jgi:hypothetical protein
MPAIDNIAGGASGLRLTKEALAMLGIESGMAPGEYSVSDQKLANNPPSTFAPSGGLVATQAGTRNAPTATSIWRFNPTGDDIEHGPFAVFVGGALFQSTFDGVGSWGYNVGDGGGTLNPRDSKIGWSFERDYDDGAKRVFEVYLEYAKASVLTVSDGVTNGTATVTSASAATVWQGGFTTTRHVGMAISGTNIPANTYIGVVNSPTSIGLSSSNTSNVPVSATGSGSGITLSIGPSGPSGLRPIFIQINKANGVFTSNQLNGPGWNFATLDGTQTTWAVLNQQGLSITPYTANTSVTLSLGGIAGGQNSISIGNTPGNPGWLLTPIALGNSQWQAYVGASNSMAFMQGGIKVGDSNAQFNGGISAMVLTADKDARHTVWLQAQAAQSTNLIIGMASDAATTLWRSAVDGTWFFGSNGQSTVVGKGSALANAATDGFLYLPIMAGTPTSAPPTARAGSAPFVYDTTAHKIWVYDSGWKGVVVA